MTSSGIASVNGRYRVTFLGVPVSQIALDLLGGHKGLLQNSEGLCGTHKQATVRIAAQNGKRANRRPSRSLVGKPTGTDTICDARRRSARR